METQEVIEAKKIDGYCPFCAQSGSECSNYLPVKQSGFKEVDLSKGESFNYDNIDFYLICFVRKGECLLSNRDGRKSILPGGSMILFGQGDTVCVVAEQKSSMVFFVFEQLPDFCEEIKLASFASYCSGEYDYTPTMMNPNIQTFLSECIFFMKHGMFCNKLSKIKQSEFFYILAVVYSQAELAAFLHPIIGRSLSFKAIILQHYTLSITATDLMKHTGFTRDIFYTRFKKEFGMSVKEWIVKQKIGQMRIIAMEARMTAQQLMYRCGFLSGGHFAQFCKRHTKMTPTELINSFK